ncbi:MAG: hypothetical protein Q8R92_15410 [Deltaproteobacteria bacterium]|nr:hypothetical protein [Deltaproteobacteria bacterium]
MKPARLSGEKLRKAMAENQEFVARTLLGVAELDAGRRLKVDLDD